MTEATEERTNLAWTIDGETYTVWPDEVTATLARDFRQATGMSFRAAIGLMGTDPDLDILQGLTYLARRQAGEKITIDDVVDLTYAQAKTLEFVTAEEEDDSPEA